MNNSETATAIIIIIVSIIIFLNPGTQCPGRV